MVRHRCQRVQQAAILGRGPNVHQADQSEQQASGPGMNGPEQRQVVVAMPGGDDFAVLSQAVDAALLSQQSPDVASKGGVGFLGRREIARSDADQSIGLAGRLGLQQHARGGEQARRIVDDEAHAVAQAKRRHLVGELLRVGQHVRQTGRRVGSASRSTRRGSGCGSVGSG